MTVRLRQLSVLGLGLLFVAAAGCDLRAVKGGKSAPPVAINAASKQGSPVLPVELTVVDPTGYEQAIAKQRGKVIVVDFWATWCGPCVKQFPHTLDLTKKYRDKDFVVMTMSVDDLSDQTEALKFLRSQNAGITNMISSLDGLTPEQAESYEITDGAIPHIKVYDRQGKMRKSYTGNAVKQGIDDLIEQLLAEPAP